MKSKNISKRVFSIFMVLILCVGVLPTGEISAKASSAGGEVAAYSTGKTIYTQFTGENFKF